MKSAMAKIGKAAMLYDRDRSITGLIGFEEGPPMTPEVLKDQLWRNFRLRLTPKELGAVVRLLDKDGDGTVDGAEFLCEFFRMGAEEKTRTRAKRREDEKKRAGKQQRLQEKWLKKFGSSVEHAAEQGHGHAYDQDEQRPLFTEMELQSATHKLGEVAATYSSKGRGPKVAAFVGGSMAKNVFKVQKSARFLHVEFG